jgi:ATP-dependent DNA helicase RecG
MDKKEFEFILSEGEGQYIEFKEKFGGSFAKEIVAFANASGGRIFLGIDDKKNVKNVQITNKLKSQIQDFANSCDPRIEISLEEFEGILIINVSEGNNKPYSCKEGFYLRVGPNSQKMKRDEIIEIIQSNFQFNFDDCYLRKEEEFSFTKFNDFLKENKLNNFLGDLNLLRSLRLIDKDNKFSNASILLFGNNPQMIFPSCYLECVMFKGKEGADVLDRKRINGTLFEQLKEGMFFLKKNLKVRYEFPDEKRREYYDVPLRALEEALVNSLIHRDYLFRGANITLSIHEDRVEIASPGGFPPGLKKEDFGNISIRRNELIADIFSRQYM